MRCTAQLPLKVQKNGFSKAQVDRCLDQMARKGHLNPVLAGVAQPFPNIRGYRGLILIFSVIDESILGRSL